MGDIQTYYLVVRCIALIVVLGYFLLVLFGKSPRLKLFFSRKALYVVLLLLVFFYGLFKHQQYQVRNSLRTLISVVDYNKTVEERLAKCNRPDSVIFDLKQHKISLKKLQEKNDFITKIVGRSESTDSLLSQMQRFLDNQIFRAENVNIKSTEHFFPTVYTKSAEELRAIKPEGLNGVYISAGLTIDEISSFRNNNTLLVRIVQTELDTVLFEQSYVPKSGINAFILPNYFNSDRIELQLGYINKQEKNTYHYIAERPYEK